MQTVEDYLSFLHTKGFKLSEEAQGFIMFDKDILVPLMGL